MKKRLEAELISIAHRILKLKNKSELSQLHAETQKLYETLSVLKFVENNINIIQPKIDVQDLEEKLTIAHENNEDNANDTKVEYEKINHDLVKKETEVTEAATEMEIPTEIPTENIEIKTTAKIEEIKIEFEPLFEITKDEVEEQKVSENKIPKQIFEDLLGHDYNNLTFEKVTVTKTEVVETATFDVKVQEENITENEAIAENEVNESTAFENVEKEEVEPITDKNQDFKNDFSTENSSKNITFGLNDRIGFEKHLFAGSSEDMNRVISQLSTYDTFQEVEDFINEMVKPDYNNWEGKEDYETRFMDIVAKKFS